MSWFHFALFLHIAGVLGLFGALAGETVGTVLLRRADTASQVGDAGSIMSRLPQLFGISGALIFLSGLYLSILRIQHDESIGWVIISLALFIVMAIFGSVSGRKTEAALKSRLTDSDGRFTPQLQEIAHRNPARANVVFGPIAVLGITLLMVYKPSVLVSLLVLVVTVLTGLLLFKLQSVERPKLVERRHHRLS